MALRQFWLVYNETTDPQHTLVDHVVNRLTENNLAVETFAVKKRECPQFQTTNSNLPDMIIVIGGDGTVLRTIQALPKHNIPLVAINTGKLGFLTRIDRHGVDAALNNLLANQYAIEHHTMLSAQLCINGVCVPQKLALNDALIKNGNPSQMGSFELHINNSLIARYDADGLIVATPTGTTAYTLSAGGPVIAPTVNAFAITPICPHSLSAKPIVVSAHERIEIRATGVYSPLVFSLDGQDHGMLNAGDSVILTEAKDKIPFVHFEEESHSFYGLLKNKLHWGMNPRKKTPENDEQ